MNRRITTSIAVLFLACTAGRAAFISAVKGTAALQVKGTQEWQPLKKGSVVTMGDRVRCGADGSIDITASNGHRVRVAAGSEIVLEDIDGENTLVNLMKGKVRSWVKKLRKAQSYRVKTSVSVCSVRGTDFAVETAGEQGARVEVYEGQVAAREEATGEEVVVNKGEFTTIQYNQMPSLPERIPEDGGQRDGQPQYINESREEARREIFQEISRDAVLSRAAEEIRIAEYQNGKTAIDASGNRIRMEEYIVRTRPEEFKYVVLNTRENRFDFGKIVFTFDESLPDDLTLATKNMYQYTGTVKPQWLLTDVLSIMSNTADQVNEEAHGGDMFADNPSNPRSWKHGFASYTFSVNNNVWWQYQDTNSNGRVEAAEILDGSGSRLTGLASVSDQPSGGTTMHFYAKNTYSDGKWIATNDYVINDNGSIISIADYAGKSPEERNKIAYESNFERVYEASVLNGRKIDLVFSAKLLIDAGMLSLPASGN